MFMGSLISLLKRSLAGRQLLYCVNFVTIEYYYYYYYYYFLNFQTVVQSLKSPKFENRSLRDDVVRACQGGAACYM